MGAYNYIMESKCYTKSIMYIIELRGCRRNMQNRMIADYNGIQIIDRIAVKSG